MSRLPLVKLYWVQLVHLFYLSDAWMIISEMCLTVLYSDHALQVRPEP